MRSAMLLNDIARHDDWRLQKASAGETGGEVQVGRSGTDRADDDDDDDTGEALAYSARDVAVIGWRLEAIGLGAGGLRRN